MVFTVLTLSQLAHVLAIRSEQHSLFSIGLLSNGLLLGAVVLTAISYALRRNAFYEGNASAAIEACLNPE